MADAAGDVLGRVAVDEDLAFGFDDLHFLFGNGPADIIGLAHGVAAQGTENLNDLLLIDDTAVGDLQDGFQKGRFVPDLAVVQLIGDKRRDGIHGAGTVECHDCRHVFNGRGLHVDADTGDACGFQLEYALGLAFRQHGEGLRVIVRDFIDVKVGDDLSDLLFRVIDDRQVPQAQKVHFQQAQFLDGGHGILGDNGIIVPGQGQIGADRVGGDNHARGMGGGVAGHALQAHGGVDEFFHPLVTVIHFFQLGADFQSFF